MKEHPFTKLDNSHYTDDREFERRTFWQWLTRQPKKLKVFNGNPDLQIMCFMALKRLAKGMVLIPPDEQLLKDLQDYPKTITYSKPPRYVN